MPQAEIVDQEKKVVGQIDLSDRVFAAPYRPSLIHQVVVGFQANQRQGTASVKNRSAVRGGGRKPWRQKGTGRARAGTIRSPLWKGGGIIFGPQPRSYRQRLPKKMRREAIRSVLSRKLQDGELLILNQLEIAEPKTRLMAGVLQNLELNGKTLLVLDQHTPDVLRAARNIPGVFVTNVDMLNAYDLTASEKVLLTQSAAEKIEEIYQS
jgi:large subunit ribosomal protein L4